MRFTYSDLNLSFELKENETVVVIVENQRLFSKMVNELINQCSGQEGGFVLADAEKIKNISKEVQLIMNPFAVDCNEKKILQKLYQEIEMIGLENYIEDISVLHSEIISCLDKLSAAVPYAMNYSIDLNLPSILKAYNVQIDVKTDSLLESIVNYLRILNELCHIHIFCFVNLKTFLSKEEIVQLYEFAFYQKLQLILLENTQKDILKDEKTCILDVNQCIININ